MQAQQQFPAAMRKQMLAKIHVAKKQLGLDDDTYRDFLQGVTERDGEGGKRSCKEMDESDLHNVLEIGRASCRERVLMPV